MKSKEFLKQLKEGKSNYVKQLPPKSLVFSFVDDLKDFLFLDCSCCTTEMNETIIQWDSLNLKLKEILVSLKSEFNQDLNLIVEDYFNQVPMIYEDLLLDAEAINKFDPASYSSGEIIMTYPGFQAIMVYRLANALYKLGIPIVPRMMSEYAHMQTGIDINPGASIGKSFFIDHGTGIVIGETTVIGNNVKIYQGVTLGALNVKKEDAKIKRHPTIEDNVIVYSGTTILGGNTIIGHDSVVGGNVWLTKSIEPYSVVHNLSEIRVRNGLSKEKQEINFVI